MYSIYVLLINCGAKVQILKELKELKELKGVKGHYFSLFTVRFSLLFVTFAAK
jgi:hypothetical protein